MIVRSILDGETNTITVCTHLKMTHMQNYVHEVDTVSRNVMKQQFWYLTYWISYQLMVVLHNHSGDHLVEYQAQGHFYNINLNTIFLLKLSKYFESIFIKGKISS